MSKTVASSSTGDKLLSIQHEWWKTNVIYQVYPLSFYDSDADGVGDLKGVLEKLDYFKWLGVRVLWLNPIYKSPMMSFSYDVVDFTSIDPLFGNFDDFKKLIKEMHNRGMYLILDFVPNHTSWNHPWFEESVKKHDPYTEYYVWKDGKLNHDTGKVEPPNNWKTVFGTTSWTWNEERKQFYLNQFAPNLPDLNFRNKSVQDEMKKILQFWLDLGVDGFRIDAIRHLVEHESFKDNTKKHNEKFGGYNVDQPETYEIVADWIQLVRKYGDEHDKYIFVVTEAYSPTSELMNYYKAGVDFPFNFALINWTKETSAESLKNMISEWLNEMPQGSWPNWVVSNHDNSRISTRLGGREYADIANMLLLLLPGTATCYYGDELGMVDGGDKFDNDQNPFPMKFGPEEFAKKVLEPWRSPMLWSQETNAGFTKAKIPWMPILKEYKEVCMEKQKFNPNSHLSLFKTLLKIRREPAFSSFVNNLKFIETDQQQIVAFIRRGLNFPSYLVVLNIGGKSDENVDNVVDLSDKGQQFQGKIVAQSTNITNEVYRVGSVLDLRKVQLKAAQGLVLEIVSKRPLSPTEAGQKKRRKRFFTE